LQVIEWYLTCHRYGAQIWFVFSVVCIWLAVKQLPPNLNGT
jgi:hypothetical protein